MGEFESRLEAFNRIKSSIRGSDRFLVVGIDVAKDSHHAFYGTPKGKTLHKNLVFDNSQNGFEALRDLARDLKNQHGLEEVVYGLEPTASYHKPLAEYLIRNDENVVYVSNLAAKKNRTLLDGRWDKNDIKDAANVADLIGQGHCLFYDMADEKVRALRSLIAFRIRMKKQEHALRMRLRNNLIAQYFPELDRLYAHPGQPDEIILAIVEHCLDPREIAQMGFEAFLKLITRRKIRIGQERLLHNLWQASGCSTGCSTGCLMNEAAKWEARAMVGQLKSTRETVKEVESKLRAVGKLFPEYPCLLSIPGYGPIVSAMVLAAIGDASRFKSRRQVLRLAGLDLCASRSGKTSNSAKPVISKEGKASLRYALVQAAMVASTSNPTIRNYYSRWFKGREFERGIRMKMKVKLAAKMLIIAWTLMKRQQKYNPSRFGG